MQLDSDKGSFLLGVLLIVTALITVVCFFVNNLIYQSGVMRLVKCDIELDLMIDSAQSFADKFIDEGTYINYEVIDNHENIFDLMLDPDIFYYRYSNYDLGVAFVDGVDRYYLFAVYKGKNSKRLKYRRYKEVR